MTIKKPKPQKIAKPKTPEISRKIGGKRPSIGGILTAQGVENPLADVDYQGDIAHDTKEEEGAMLKHLKEAGKVEKRRYDVAVDSEFWFAVYFQSREQKDAFLTAMNWLKYGNKYLNGLQLADLQGILIPNESLTTQVRGSGKLAALAEDLGKIKIKQR